MNSNQQNAWIELMLSFSKYVDTRISRSGGHSTQVAKWGKSTARKLNCNDQEIDALYWAAHFHDIGKLGVPDKVLRKAGPLTEQEWQLIKLHPTVGANMISLSSRMSHVVPVIYAHQERFDGSGYPEGSRGNAIPLGARILAVVDAYEAMTNDRYYRLPRNHQQATLELQRFKGSQFDPLVVDAFLEIVDNHPRASRVI